MIKYIQLHFLLFFLGVYQINAQVVINEIMAPGTIELKNIGNTTIDVSSFFLHDFPMVQSTATSTLSCGPLLMNPGDIIAVNDFNVVDPNDGEMALYNSPDFGNPNALEDYVEWGSSDHGASSLAVFAGMWSPGDFVPSFGAGNSLEYDGTGDSSSDWFDQSTPTICMENTGPGCMADGGMLTGGPFEFCVGDGIPDMIPSGGITLSGNSGPNNDWIVTDASGIILGIPPSPSDVNFDGVGPGNCFIYHISYENDLSGLLPGADINNDLTGCFDLSNAITVVRNQPEGGTVSGVIGLTYSFCVGDGIPDMVQPGDVTVSNNMGSNSQWVVTNEQITTILGLPPSPSDVDFDGAGPGTCLIWHLSYENGLTGLEVNGDVSALDGCFSFSNNSVSVIRSQPNGGILNGGPFEFCVGDGIPDTLAAGDVTLSGNSGTNSAWLVTDQDGFILGSPPMITDVNFDGAGPGNCFIYNISFENDVTGLLPGANINTDVMGCFDLSNGIEVVRLIGNDCMNTCSANGGIILGGPFEFCVGDGVADTLAAGSISLSGNVGSNSQWVVTDTLGEILGLPPMPSAVNFDGAGPGVCLIRHLAFDDTVAGLETGNSIDNLEGCFNLSNSVNVVRYQPVGGTLQGGPFEFCVGDGIDDFIPGDSVSLFGNNGPNFQWIISDTLGQILGLPSSPSDVNFENAGVGVCLIWNLSFGDTVGSLGIGNNFSDLSGCFNFSNSLTVNRGHVDAGNIAGGPFEFCVGDGIDDTIPPGSITVSGTMGTSFQWIVTDEQNKILGLPPTPFVVNFDDAGAGNCLIYNLVFEDILGGLEVGNNTADLTGCFDLSNSIQVIRLTGNDCQNNCDANGGIITGGPYNFCVGNGLLDTTITPSVFDPIGPNFQWVITDTVGEILGLPPVPSDVNFDGAGPGTCLIWHLAFTDTVGGLEVGGNTANLEGCFDFSNPITVNRFQPDGGIITGGPYNFCVGDGLLDTTITPSVFDPIGPNFQWVITDTVGEILGLPPLPSDVNFDGAGPGTCLIWHLAFTDTVGGLDIGGNTSNLQGCFDFSNPITVNRFQPDGGTLSGGPFEFCVGDGIADMIPAEAISLSGNSGSNSQWVVTDNNGNILGLPPSPADVNFDGAGVGTCLVYHLSFATGISGLLPGNNIQNLQGCFDLSNAVSVNRMDCSIDCTGSNNEGGFLFGGPFEFCVGDGKPDYILPLSIVQLGAVGDNLAWIVTDDAGNILGLPNAPWDVNFDGAGTGTCLVYLIAYDDELMGLETGNNVSTLQGCFDLSTPVMVNRMDCNSQSSLGSENSKTIYLQNVVGLEIKTLFPNPATRVLNTLMASNVEFETNLQVIDTNGRMIIQQEIFLTKGVNHFALDIAHLSDGIYILNVINSEGQVLGKRFVKAGR